MSKFFSCFSTYLISFDCIPDIVMDIFAFLEISLGFILGCSYVEIVWSFWVLLLLFARQDRAATTEAGPFYILYPMSYESWGFLVLLETVTVPETTRYYSLKSFGWFFSWLWGVYSHSAEHLSGSFWKLARCLSLCPSLFSGTVLWTLAALVSRLWAPNLQLRTSAGLCLLCHPGKSLKTAEEIVGLALFDLSLWNHCPSLPSLQCLEKPLLHIFCSFFSLVIPWINSDWQIGFLLL